MSSGKCEQKEENVTLHSEIQILSSYNHPHFHKNVNFGSLFIEISQIPRLLKTS